jgi:L-asparaginase/Glu-tRNA(Gln) amidotransferase subunit D
MQDEWQNTVVAVAAAAAALLVVVVVVVVVVAVVVVVQLTLCYDSSVSCYKSLNTGRSSETVKLKYCSYNKQSEAINIHYRIFRI